MKGKNYLLLACLGFLLACSSQSETENSSDQIPEADRFIFEDLVSNLNEPMELDFLPDGKILFIERRGILKMYDPETQITQVVGEIEVNYINENGLLGMALDPNFSENSWIYFFYTDPKRKSYQHISRFTFKDNSLLLASEKLLLDFYIDYKNCCHFGGCIAFGPNGNLFISSGDNVGGKDYAPLDERPGRHLHDAQRTSANANDLRGSILRIKPEDDGSYSIPEGNLFPPGTAGTRPEIYVMGARNALKINVDQENGFLYWGDVGPNPGWKYKDWGPASHEEINQAREPGNFGWPYFLADNKAFRDLDFASQTPADFFEAEAVVNNSPNNTGIQELPPAQKALIWYPNTNSDSFPLTGKGGGTACAGPVYHYDASINNKGKWPKYYDDQLIIYEWMRSWVLSVKLDEAGDYVGMENIFEGNPFKKPIDIEFGPDGAMYVLDYGSNWYAHNPDSRLTRVSYEYGNRSPQASISTDKKQGASPLHIQFSAENSWDKDEKDQLSYHWDFGDGSPISKEKSPLKTYTQNGNYEVRLIVRDQHNAADTSYQFIQAGNEPAEIQLKLIGNNSFFFPGEEFEYQFNITDKEDGNSQEEDFPFSELDLSLQKLDHSISSQEVLQAAKEDASLLTDLRGKALLEGSDCYACHALNKSSVGPSYQKISEKYLKDVEAKQRLSQKVLKGGMGVWGEKLMPAHPQHSLAEAQAMIDYILNLEREKEEGKPLSIAGAIPTQNKDRTHLLLLHASYTDQGGGGQAPIQTTKSKILRAPIIPAIAYDYAYRITPKPIDPAGSEMYAEVALNGCYLGFADIDLSGIKQVNVQMASHADFVKVEVRQGSFEGPLIGSQRKDLPHRENKWETLEEKDWFTIEVDLAPAKRQEDLFFVFYSDKEESDYIYFDICRLRTFEFVFQDS